MLYKSTFFLICAVIEIDIYNKFQKLNYNNIAWL